LHKPGGVDRQGVSPDQVRDERVAVADRFVAVDKVRQLAAWRGLRIEDDAGLAEL
jgi:hypothetical protein